MLSFKAFDRPFVFLGSYTSITPFKVAEVISKNDIGPNAKKQNGEANGSPVSAVTSPDAHVTTQNANDI
ncbi:hypothetical protein Lser_V15G43169 [Lactuca serriola]